MTRRRPGTASSPHRPVADSVAPSSDGSTGAWYVALISVVLLVAAGIYAAYLYQQVETGRQAVEQLKLGQELLRFDRDEILQKMREREVTLSTLEAAREQDRERLEGLEKQRRRLQGDVLKLTQTLARGEQVGEGAALDAGHSTALERLQRERERLDLELAGARTDMTRLKTALAEQTATLQEYQAKLEAMGKETTDLEAAKASQALDMERLELQLDERREVERRLQIVRGHRASFGEVTPYIAEVGPEEWRVIESWLAQQLGRPMAVPDLSAHDWSYEGARLLGVIDGPPMAMLLYADADERPVSLTIARNGGGARPLEISENGGLALAEWQEERHAFFLTGEAGEDLLKRVAIDLQNQPPMLSEDAPVPISRYIRPSFRPKAQP